MTKANLVLKTFLYVLITLLIIAVLYFFIDKTYMIAEDYRWLFFYPNTNIVDLYKDADHGSFIAIIISKIFGSYIPLSFNVHPNDNYFGNFFKVFNFITVMFLISRFSITSNKSKFLGVFNYFLAAFSFSVLFLGTSAWDSVATLFVSGRNYRYIFMMIFYLLFWLNFYKIYLTKKWKSGLSFFLFIVICFCSGLSTEFINISIIFSLLFLLLFPILLGSILKSRYFKIKHYYPFFKKFIFKSKKIYILGIAFLSGLFLLYFNPSFTRLAKDRGVAGFEEVLYTFRENFIEFSKYWFLEVFVYDFHWVVSLSILLLTIFCFSLAKNKVTSLKVIYFSYSLIFGVMVFNYSLILSGKTFRDFPHYWVSCPSLGLDTLIVLLSALFVLFGYCSRELIKQRKYLFFNLTALYLVGVLFFIPALHLYKSFDDNFFYYYKLKLSNSRKMMYKLEKMYRFYTVRKEQPILSDEILNVDIFREEIIGCFRSTPQSASFIEVYFPALYGEKNNLPIKLLPEEKAMQEYYKRGGKFEKTELEQPKFSRLLDEQFVVNN